MHVVADLKKSSGNPEQLKDSFYLIACTSWRNYYKGTFMCYSLTHCYLTGISDNTQGCARKVSIALEISHVYDADTRSKYYTIIRCSICASSAVKWFTSHIKKKQSSAIGQKKMQNKCYYCSHGL